MAYRMIFNSELEEKCFISSVVLCITHKLWDATTPVSLTHESPNTHSVPLQCILLSKKPVDWCFADNYLVTGWLAKMG